MSSDTSNAYIKVTVGTPVQTLDNQAIGQVAELRGMYFKVKSHWWQRSYWLRLDSVRSAAPNLPVILNVPKVRLEEIKMAEDPTKE
jgi:hypothetical protein